VDYQPAAPGPNEVRVANHAIGLNFIDTYYRSGLYSPAALPSGLGAEGAGVVEAVGSAVSHLKVGDRVAYGTGPLGAYSELHVLPAAHLVKLPDSISFELAASVMLKGLTVQYLLRQTYPLKGGETILFHAAAGGVGSIACQWAKALGVKLIGTVGSPAKAERAKALGAWATIDYSHEDVAARVLELTEGKKCPVVYDSIGKDTWETSLNCTAPRGLLVSFGNSSGPVSGVNLGVLAQKGSLFVTRPTLGSYADSPAALQAMADELFAMLASGQIQVDINQRFALKDVAAAHVALSGRQTSGSTVLLP
jgi:NADPH2:quinone reductase